MGVQDRVIELIVEGEIFFLGMPKLFKVENQGLMIINQLKKMGLVMRIGSVGYRKSMRTNILDRGSVIVSLVCHKKILWTGRLKQQKCFFLVLKSGSPRLECQPGWSLVRAIFLDCRQLPSCGTLMRQRGNKLSGVSSLRTLTHDLDHTLHDQTTSQRLHL